MVSTRRVTLSSGRSSGVAELISLAPDRLDVAGGLFAELFAQVVGQEGAIAVERMADVKRENAVALGLGELMLAWHKPMRRGQRPAQGRPARELRRREAKPPEHGAHRPLRARVQ